MSITVLNYHDTALVEQVRTQAAQRAQTAQPDSTLTTENDFSSVLEEASSARTTTEPSSQISCPGDLDAIFEEAASTFGVSVNLLKSIAQAESNFTADAVSHAGAVGIMQLMPATAASLGVTNSYDPRENIMGGAKYISQLLSRYDGNTSLALAAYNAGSGNVDKYGGIPPFTETQNYVQKVLSYMNAGITDTKDQLKETVANFLSSNNIGKDTLNLLVELINLVKENTSTVPADTSANTSANNGAFHIGVVDGSHIVSNLTPSAAVETATEVVETADRSDADGSSFIIPDKLEDLFDSGEEEDMESTGNSDTADEAINTVDSNPDDPDSLTDNSNIL